MNYAAMLLVAMVSFGSCTNDKVGYRTEPVTLGAKIPKYKLEISRTKTYSSGALSNTLVMETLGKRKDLFDYCYEDALLRNRSLQAQGVWQLGTSKKGVVTSFKYLGDESSLKQSYLESCVGYHLLRTQFPASIKGDSTIKIHMLFSILKN